MGSMQQVNNSSPSGLVVRADSDDVLFFDSYHGRMVSEFSYVTDAGLEALSNVPRELMVGVTGPNQV